MKASAWRHHNDIDAMARSVSGRGIVRFMRWPLALAVSLVAVVGCSRKDPAPAPPPASSVATPLLPLPPASGGHKREGRGEDRHEAAKVAKLTLAVTIQGATKTWNADDFAKVPKTKGIANDGDDRDTWSLRDMARTLVGPGARVTAVIGDTKVAIDPSAWTDGKSTPILHTTRRGALKFRYADARGAWGEAEVSDVTGLEVTP